MAKNHKHIIRKLSSTIDIHCLPEIIWENITNVKIEQFSDPIIFRALDIPKPLKAEVLMEGQGGKRIAYFDNGKKFIQKILIWEPNTQYSFSFNPEKGFRICYFFELSEGIFQIPKGSYSLEKKGNITTLKLTTEYSIDKRFYFPLNIPVKIILKAFQNYLLASIKNNSK